MPAMIAVWNNQQTARIENGEWACENEDLKQVLDAVTDQTDPSPADGDSDIFIAREAVRILGGVVVSEESMDFDPQTIY